MSQHPHYVYTLAYPDGRVFYVGKGVNDRISEHERAARRGVQSKKCDIIRSIWAQGGEVVRRKVAFFQNEEEALRYEHYLISSLDGLINQFEGSDDFVTVSISPADERVFGASIKRRSDDGEEYWSAREVANYLGYAKWDAFKRVIARAKKAMIRSGMNVSQEIREASITIRAGYDARRVVDDYQLSSVGFLLVVQNADPAKSMVAYGKTYIAEQVLRATAPEAFNALLAHAPAPGPDAKMLLSRSPRMKLRQLTGSEPNTGDEIMA